MDSNAVSKVGGDDVGVLVEQMRCTLIEEWLSGQTAHLTAAERGEIHNMAAGMTGKMSAQASGISVDTVRARRKRIYKKLNLDGSHSVMQSLLALGLSKLAGRR